MQNSQASGASVRISPLEMAAIAFAIRTSATPRQMYDYTLSTAAKHGVGGSVTRCLTDAASIPPADYETQQGWVVIALQNAFYQLLHAPNLEEGIVNTVGRGSDTDTNGAIAGALLGSVYRAESVPSQWTECILNCRPRLGAEAVHQPRPEDYWPVDALELAATLLTLVPSAL